MTRRSLTPAPGGSGRVPKPLALALLTALVLPLVGVGLAALLVDDPQPGDPGARTETLRVWRPTDGEQPVLAEITEPGGFTAWRHSGESQTSGGAAIADLDDDGWPDVVVGGGTAGVYFGAGAGRWDYVELAGDDADVTSVAVGHLDDDPHLDVALGGAGEVDTVVWGGAWSTRRSGSGAARSKLPSGQPTTGLLIADLHADGARELVRLGYGPRGDAAPDIVWMQATERDFEAVELPNSRRLSLAAEVVDVDGDGTSELWVTRDVRWMAGADSLYGLDRTSGDWVDRAPALGADLAVDGMGVTVADLTGDGRLDAYVSDLGDNELLERRAGGTYRRRDDLGLARIRPPGADASVISSSWASAAVDFNLDGRLDVVVANGGFDPGADILNKVDGTNIVDADPPAILLGRADGTYADVWPAAALGWSGRTRGMSAGDLDGDGDTDLVFVIHGEGLRVFRNDTAGAAVRVVPGEGCDASGASVSVSSGLGTSVSTLSPHTFLGAHAAEHISGVAGPVEVTVRYGSNAVSRDLPASGERTDVVVPCP